MDWYAGPLIGTLIVLFIALLVAMNRKRAKEEVGLSPEELRKKKMLEDMADNLSP